MKLCKDCKYVNTGGNYEEICTHPESVYSRSPISGVASYRTCTRMRYRDGICGLDDAKLYEPKLLTNTISIFGKFKESLKSMSLKAGVTIK